MAQGQMEAESSCRAISAGKPLDGIHHTIRLSYDNLKSYRLRLTEQIRRMLETGEVRTPRELTARLKRFNILASEGDFASDEVVSEFVRAELLSGNGTLLINNDFVEWSAVQAIRRARPPVMIVSSGIRNRLKPFSSLVTLLAVTSILKSFISIMEQLFCFGPPNFPLTWREAARQNSPTCSRARRNGWTSDVRLLPLLPAMHPCYVL
jgi:hypothetical protein